VLHLDHSGIGTVQSLKNGRIYNLNGTPVKESCAVSDKVIHQVNNWWLG
jgi:hypothetical protein